jgi:hypothetical protein
MVAKEEGALKLWFSGYAARSLFHIITGGITLYFFPEFKRMCKEAYDY